METARPRARVRALRAPRSRRTPAASGPGRLAALALVGVCGCASGSIGRETHPDGLARILIGEESRIARTCAQLESGVAGGDGVSPIAARAMAAETERDACRLASVLDPKLRAQCDLATAQVTIDGALAKDPPPWLTLVLKSSGAQVQGHFDAPAFAARFDFSRVLARKLAEVGDRAASFSAQLSQSFGRFAGAVQLGIDLLIAEATASSLERLLDQPAVRALAEPTEIARVACRQLDDGQSRPLVTRRILKRAILRLDPPTDVHSPGQLCAAKVRPATCDRLVGSASGPEAVRRTDELCRTVKHRSTCDYLWFLVASQQARPLAELCKQDEHPAACEALAKARRSSQSEDDVCRDASLPHERTRCRSAVRWFAARNLWHDNAAENVCWSNPDRCARIKHHVMPDLPVAQPVTPHLDAVVEAAPTASPDLAACLAAASQVCGDRCPEGASTCDDAMACIDAACETVAMQPDAIPEDPVAAVAHLRSAVAAELSTGVARRADLVPLARGVDEVARAQSQIASGVGRLPADLGNALKAIVPELARGADGGTMRRLEGLLDQIEAKQARLDEAKARQRKLAERLELVARVAGFTVRATATGVSVVLSNVLFEDAASDLTVDARTQVCKVADALASPDVGAMLGPDYRLEIVGYSSPSAIVSSRRKEDSNMLLSIDRAYAAYDWLTENPDKAESKCAGHRCRDTRSCSSTVPQHRVQVIGRGYNDDAIGGAEVLRRVEIHVEIPELAAGE